MASLAPLVRAVNAARHAHPALQANERLWFQETGNDALVAYTKHTADLADQAGVPFAEIAPATTERLACLLDPGLIPVNPLDVWGTGNGTEDLFTGSLTTLAGDPAVAAVALAVDLAPELDGDQSYQAAARVTAAATDLPVVVLANLPGGIDQEAAGRLREDGIPVLEGMRTGLLALRHLLDHAAAREDTTESSDMARRPLTRVRMMTMRISTSTERTAGC